MLSVAASWLLLCLPGYALLRRLWPTALEGGLLSGVALGYLASFALLTPVSVLAYAFRLPLAVLSIAIGACVLLALGALLRDARRSFRALRWPRLTPIGVFAFALVANDAIAGLALGAPHNGDARYHIARVRMLVDHGFNSWDPIDAGHRMIDTVYHTNLYHALMAAIAQLTSLEPADAWTFTLFFARLAACASVYHLAWVVLRKRSLAWIAATALALSASSGRLLVIPNNVSVFVLLTLGLAFAVQVLRNEDGVRPALAFALTCIVLPQFHGLDYVFLALAAAPALAGRLVYLQLRKLPGRRELVLCLLGLGLGSLWLADQVWQRLPTVAVRAVAGENPEPSSQPAPVRRAHKHPARAQPTGFVELPDGELKIDPGPLIDPRSAPAQVLLALAVGLCTRRRREVLALWACLAAVLALLLVPALSTAALHVAGKGWMVARLMGVFYALHPALVPGTFLLLLWERFSPIATRLSPRLQLFTRAWLPLGGLCAAVAIVGVVDGNAALWPQENRWSKARAAVTTAALDQLATQRAFLRRFVDPGAIVAAKPVIWYDLMLTCNCYPLAFVNSRDNHGLADMPERRAAAETLFSLDATLDERIRILRHYGVRHIFVDHYVREDRRLLRRLYAPLTVDAGKSDGSEVLKLSIDPH